MAKTPEDKVYKEIAVIAKLPKYETEKSKVVHMVRVVDAPTEPKMRLDIRESIETSNYKGFTARGIALAYDQIDAMIAAMQKGKEKLGQVIKANGGSKKSTKKSK